MTGAVRRAMRRPETPLEADIRRNRWESAGWVMLTGWLLGTGFGLPWQALLPLPVLTAWAFALGSYWRGWSSGHEIGRWVGVVERWDRRGPHRRNEETPPPPGGTL
jgi:hypothetical protein